MLVWWVETFNLTSNTQIIQIYKNYSILYLSCSWSEVCIGDYKPARARLSLYWKHLHASQPIYTRASERRDKTWTHPLECTEGRRAFAALLFTADALTLLARGADEAFMRYCNKPDASLPARQTERTAFRRFYRSCCCCCSSPWWTAHSTAVRTPNGHMRGWPRTLLTEITALLGQKV